MYSFFPVGVQIESEYSRAGPIISGETNKPRFSVGCIYIRTYIPQGQLHMSTSHKRKAEPLHFSVVLVRWASTCLNRAIGGQVNASCQRPIKGEQN